MPLSGFFDAISQVAKFSRRWDADFVDRMNHKSSALMLVTMTVIVSYKQYVGEPIVCWCPGIWTGAMVDYAHQICWISNTYYLPPGTAPLTKDQPRVHVLIYYQWVPFILLAQAFMFQLPNIFWKVSTQFVGMDINRLARSISGIENVNPEIRDRTVRVIVKQMDRSLAISAWRSGGRFNRCMKKVHNYMCIIGCGRGFGNYLTTMYIICKLIYVGNSFGQLFALNFLLGAERLGMHFLWYGVEIINIIFNGQGLNHVSKIFPRVTLCDFNIRQFANFHQYTIECTLPINLFNEKIFIIIWFWLVLMTLFNTLNLLSWISSLFSVSRTAYVKKYLLISERMRRTPLDRRHLRCFSEYYLRQDGVFAIRMLSKNTNDVVVSEVVCKLWDHFILHHSQRTEFHQNHPLDVDVELADSRTNARPSRLMNTSSTAITPTTPGNIFP